MTATYQATYTGQQACELFDANVEAECIDGVYQITGFRREKFSAGITPWAPEDLVVHVVTDCLQGWSDYTHFLRIESADGSQHWCVMARLADINQDA